MVSPVFLMAVVLSCHVYLATATPKVTWNGRLVPDGGRLRVPIKFSTSGEKFIQEEFVCEGSDAAEKMMMSFKVPGLLPVTVWSYRSREIFTFTTVYVDKLISCSCIVSYSSFGTVRTETSSFYLSSQADIKKGPLGLSMSLLSSVLTSVLVAQLLGHKSWL